MSGHSLSRCRLCGQIPRRGTTEHHLIPRTCHRNRWFQKRFTREQMRQTISLCRRCHETVHRVVPSEKELGRHYNTEEALRSHVVLARYLQWAYGRR